MYIHKKDKLFFKWLLPRKTISFWEDKLEVCFSSKVVFSFYGNTYIQPPFKTFNHSNNRTASLVTPPSLPDNFFFFFLVFIYLFWERVKAQVGGGARGGGREGQQEKRGARIPSRLRTVSAEPEVGLHPTNLWGHDPSGNRVGCLSGWATQVFLSQVTLTQFPWKEPAQGTWASAQVPGPAGQKEQEVPQQHWAIGSLSQWLLGLLAMKGLLFTFAE